MKSRILKIAFVAAIAMVGGINVFNAQKTETLSDVALANVEALASGESSTGNKAISDEIQSMDITPYGIRTTYKRSCAYGGSSDCTPGTYTDYTPMY